MIPFSIACAVFGPALCAEQPATPPPAQSSQAEDDLRMVFDKGRIAREAYDRLLSLEETGRPHIPKGTILEDMRTDPKAAQVDLERLRQRTIALYETRGYDPSPITPREEDAAAVPVPQARPARGRSWLSQWVAAGALLGFGALLSLGLKFVLRPKPEKPSTSPGSSKKGADSSRTLASRQPKARRRPVRAPTA